MKQDLFRRVALRVASVLEPQSSKVRDHKDDRGDSDKILWTDRRHTRKCSNRLSGFVGLAMSSSIRDKQGGAVSDKTETQEQQQFRAPANEEPISCEHEPHETHERRRNVLGVPRGALNLSCPCNHEFDRFDALFVFSASQSVPQIYSTLCAKPLTAALTGPDGLSFGVTETAHVSPETPVLD
jgi:hypothetical protein